MAYNKKNGNKSRQEEWQTHQYDPGHYLGGKQHYSLENPGKPAMVGMFILLTGVLQIVIMGFITSSLLNDKNTLKVLLLYCAICIVSVIYLKAGLRLIRKSYNEVKYKAFKRKVIMILSAFFILIFINTHFLVEKKSFVINDSSQIEIVGNIYESYVKTPEVDVILIIDNEEKYILYDADTKKTLFPIQIFYKKHYFFSKGKITRLVTSNEFGQ